MADSNNPTTRPLRRPQEQPTATKPASPAIYGLIPKIMASVGAIAKTRQSGERGPKYQFRGIDDMYNAIQPAFIEHGVFVVPQVLEQTREERRTGSGTAMIYTILKVRHTFYAPDGSMVEAITVGEAFDTSDKSSNKAMSAAMKYAMIEVFCIPTEGDNDSENTHLEPAAKDGAARQPGEREDSYKLRTLIATAGVPAGMVERWLKQGNVKAVGELPADATAACINYIEDKIAKANGEPGTYSG